MFAKFRTLSGALAAGALIVTAGVSAAHAGPQDYRFEMLQPQVKAGDDAQIAIRLIHVPTGKPVENAVIFQTRLDMSPMGMADMTAKATPVKAEEPGLYKFRAPLAMDGEWGLQVSAKVPGESESVRGSLKFRAVK